MSKARELAELSRTVADSADAVAITVDSNENTTFTGVVTANAGVVVDNITIDGTEIDLSSGDLTLDVAGDIILDSDNAAFRFKDAGTTLATFTSDSGSMVLYNATSDKDLIFKGNDGGSTVTALTLDMSEAGKATFNSSIDAGGTVAMPNGYATAKFAVASTGVHGSYDFYNNGSTYLNGAATVDDSLTVNGDVSVTGAFAYASGASSLATTVSKAAARIRGSSDASTSLFFGSLTNDAEQYIQSSNGAGNAADDLVLNPYGGKVGIGSIAPFAPLHLKNTSWSSGSPYGTVQLIEGNAVNDNNWGHLVITDTDTAVGQGGAISFATGAASSMNPFAGIKGGAEGSGYGALDFYTRPSGGTATQRMRITSAGLVGIGTTDMQNQLNVGGAASGDSAIYILGSRGSADNLAAGNLTFRNVSNGTGDVNLTRIQTLTGTGSSQSQKGQLTFSTNNGSGLAERIRIDSSGSLLVDKAATGIGTAGIELTHDNVILGTRDGGTAQYLNRLTSDGNVIEFQKTGSTVGSIGAKSGVAYIVLNDTTSDNVAALKGAGGAILPSTNAGADKDGTMSLGSSDARFATGYFSGDVNATNFTGVGDGDTFIGMSGSNIMRFSTGNEEAARIDSSQNFLVGLTSIGATPNQGFGVAISGTSSTGNIKTVGTGSHTHFIVVNASNIVGGITSNSSSTAYNTSSDYRLKENVVAMTGATERLKQLNPSRFNFIADADTTVDGFLAHEVQDIVPEAITGTKDAVDADGNPEYQGIDQSKLVPLLVATIQELEARIAALES